MIRHALIMAAGRGNRMRPLTDSIPKAMVPYRGDTLIGNSLEMLKSCVANIHITVGYKKAMLAEYLMARGVSSIINTEGHGNAWWIQNTLMRYLDEPVLVLTTDNITRLDLHFLSEEYVRVGLPAGMLVPVIPVPGIEGDFIRYDGDTVIAVKRNEPQDIYCSGMQVINPKKVSELIDRSDDFYQVWNGLIQNRQLKVAHIYPNHWYSVDTLEQLALSEKDILLLDPTRGKE